MSEDEKNLRDDFLKTGQKFFSANSGKNTPNILCQLNGKIESLDSTLKMASASSEKLATSLNKLTQCALWIAGLGLVIAVLSLIVSIIELCSP